MLSQVRWRRIVLDEAHCIKDRACNTAKAVFALSSKYKWALSGTPLQVNEASSDGSLHGVALSACIARALGWVHESHRVKGAHTSNQTLHSGRDHVGEQDNHSTAVA